MFCWLISPAYVAWSAGRLSCRYLYRAADLSDCDRGL